MKLSVKASLYSLAIMAATIVAAPFVAHLQTSAAQTPASPESAALTNLRWRSIGPANMGGRVTDIAGIPGNPDIYYVAGANGGIHKTINGGVTFRPIFENQEVYSIGALAIAPSDNEVLWVGTGEGDPRNSASFGNGVYRSIDGGDSWKHLGLPDTERIKRIRVHPTDPDTAYVCALGHAWGPNEERGVFQTTDGGKNWQKILYIDKDTACSDLDMDPQNPRILYAGMWTHRRKPWTFSTGGGQTALYQSKDGGATWKKLTTGLPRTEMDRIGVAVSRSNPNTVYMVTETKNEGVLFRSDDRGTSWRAVNFDPNINFRPFYYSDIRVDPTNPERVYSLSGSLMMSTDGGRTFTRIANNVHGDHQSFWIDPANPNRILSGSDGGFQISFDGAKTFEIVNNIVLSQYYHITYDMRVPYHVYGGLQDNGNWVGPSATRFREGIRKDDWYTVSGGDGFFVQPDLSSPNIVYSDSQGGSISVIDTNTGVSRTINPYPRNVGSTGGPIFDYKYRFNWNPPIVASPHDPKTIYFGGNVLFKTSDQGHSWQVISPDLTTNDKSKQQSSGGPVGVDNTAAEFHCTILTIAESPVKPGVIWVGTDDGNIQVTQDGGKSWKNVVANIKGLPANSWVAAIDASHFDAGTAYVAIDRHQDDDFSPHAFMTSDFGQTWKSIKGNLPPKGYVHIVREDPKVKTLLYAGTELGVFASWDGGNRWISIRNNLPPVAVNDIAIHPRDNDLIVGTHGRGAWIMDNIAPLQQLAQAMAAEAYLFDLQPASRYQIWSKDASLGSKTFTAQNPPNGAVIDYYLKQNFQGPVNIVITDSKGQSVRTIRSMANRAGVNRTIWDLRYDGPPPAFGGGGGMRGGGGGGGAGGVGGAGGGPGAAGGRGAAAAGPQRPAGAPGAAEADLSEMFGAFGFGTGPSVLPGDYTITINAGNNKMAKTLKVTVDPRIKISDADLADQLSAGMEMRDLTTKLNNLVTRLDDINGQLNAIAERNQRRTGAAATDGATGAPAVNPADIRTAQDQLKALRAKLVRECTMGYRCQGRLRDEANSLMSSINGTIARPTEGQKTAMREMKEETSRAVDELNQIVNTSIKKINDQMSSMPHISTGGR
ncbi:MAG: hypothetical protein IPJ07_16585 [Acidobacteria bacterium]|nr:hypothetical protein [Acidobacteriota bacterium]